MKKAQNIWKISAKQTIVQIHLQNIKPEKLKMWHCIT